MSIRVFFIAALTLISFSLSAIGSQNGATLSLEEYLNQVKTGHAGYGGSIEASKGSFGTSKEGKLLVAPTLYGSATLASDSKLPALPIFSYDEAIANTYTLGISQLTTFGLQAKLSYNVNYFNYVNPSTAFPSYHETRPTIELTQSLWNNGFGRGTRANQEMLEAQALASSYASRFQAQGTLVEAETSYWRLALARQNLSVQKEALERGKKIHEWALRRVRLHLGEDGDDLQARAALEVKQLDFQAAQDEEREASRSFNSARGIDSDHVAERLAVFDLDMIDRIATPKRAEMRADVKAAEQAEKAASANSTLGLERDSPTLDVYGSYSFNGRQNEFANALGDPFRSSRPTLSVGMRFSAPIDFSATSSSRDGWRARRIGAEKTYQRKLFEQEQSWKTLNQKLTEAKRRLRLVRSIETTQETKLSHERKKLQRGRTTTYQVLLFEQDYAQAQLARIRGQADVLNLIAQMKLFGESL